MVDVAQYGFRVEARAPATEPMDLWDSGFGTKARQAFEVAIATALAPTDCYIEHAFNADGDKILRLNMSTLGSSFFSLVARTEIEIVPGGLESNFTCSALPRILGEGHLKVAVSTKTFGMSNMKSVFKEQAAKCIKELASKMKPLEAKLLEALKVQRNEDAASYARDAFQLLMSKA